MGNFYGFMMLRGALRLAGTTQIVWANLNLFPSCHRSFFIGYSTREGLGNKRRLVAGSGRPVRTACAARSIFVPRPETKVLFALCAHCGRDVRAPSDQKSKSPKSMKRQGMKMIKGKTLTCATGRLHSHRTEVEPRTAYIALRPASDKKPAPAS